MKNLISIPLIIYTCVTQAQFNYPPSKTVDSSDTYHNITVTDPYRWLEDLKNPEVEKWFKAQADFTNNYMKNLKYTSELYNFALRIDSIRPDQIFKVRQVGTVLFYFNQKIGDSKPKVYKRNGEFGKEELLASSEMWGKDFTISDYEIDPYQKYIALVAGENGQEKQIAKFYSIADNKILKDTLNGSFAGFASGIGNAIYFEKPTWDVHVKVKEKEVVYKSHLLGAAAKTDKVYYSFKTNPEFYTDDDNYAPWIQSYDKDCNYEIIKVGSVSPYNEVYGRPANSTQQWKKIIAFDDKVTSVTGNGDKLYFVSLNNAPNGKLMMVDLKYPDLKNAQLIAAEKEIPLQVGGELSHSKNFFILPYMKNGVQMFTDVVDLRTDKVSKIPFPETTNLMYITPFNKENDDVHIVRSGWINPLVFTYSNLNIPLKEEKEFSFRKKVSYPYTEEVTVEEIEIPSHDGVLIPLSLIYKKGLKRDGKNMAYVYGYGAYGYSSSAVFNPDYLLYAHKGIVVAVAHVRGGGEKGEVWHLAGQKQTKCNTWKDLNACAEYLIDKKFTSPKHLVCEGGSAGGILIGRAVTERPDLWACAIPRVGCLTVLRQETGPNGAINTPEFGTVKDVNEFFGLMQMDALLHVQNGTNYPAMLITTGWNDPRVISWQPAKFAAAVQKANKSDKPILLHVDYTSGHFNSDDKFARYLQYAQSFAFAMEQCGYEDRLSDTFIE
ncbi:MAG: prolyl oligopeptidase family serine peptidase [Bacteroidia bacterium]